MCDEVGTSRITRRRMLGIAGAGLVAACAPAPSRATAGPPRTDAAGLIEGITWYKQSAFRWRGEKLVYVDPWGLTGDLPAADLVLVTHIHQDHFSAADIDKVRGPNTVYVAPKDVAAALSGNVRAVAPGDRIEAAGVKIEAVPAYNIVEARLSAHPKANNWVGYVMEIGGRTYYHAGDTDHLPELERLRVDAAFVPIGGRFAMGVPEAAALVQAMRPALAVPMHYGFFPGAGKASDGLAFRTQASPIEVHVFTPLVPFANLG